jgi:hypothetical protein
VKSSRSLEYLRPISLHDAAVPKLVEEPLPGQNTDVVDETFGWLVTHHDREPRTILA